jgi:hypothetical protein
MSVGFLCDLTYKVTKIPRKYIGGFLMKGYSYRENPVIGFLITIFRTFVGSSTHIAGKH